jgi:hypothetical protein
MATSLPVFTAFALYERRKTRRDNSPLVVPGLFGERAFVSGLLLNVVFFSGVAAFFLTFSLFLQIGLGFTALHSGLTTIPFSVGSAVGSAVSVRLAPRLGRSILSLGCLLLVAGMLAVIATISRYGEHIHSWQLLPGLVICGLGLGLTVPPLINVILAGISGRNAGSASGVLSTTQQVGGALGVAIIGVIFFGLLASQASSSADAVASKVSDDLQQTGVPVATQDKVVKTFRACFRDRAAEKDPSAVSPSCRQTEEQKRLARSSPTTVRRVQDAVSSAAVEARERDFTASIRRTLYWEVGAFLGVFLLVFLLPEKPRLKTFEQPPTKAAKRGGR